jgi:hypothetical protein
MPAYPRDFFLESRAQVEPSLCFVLMPFKKKFNRVWEIIRVTAESDPFNLQCLRADQISRPGYIMEDVLQYIARASTIIADLTDRNPNVFYELGIARTHKASTAVFLLSQSIDFIPFDLRHLRCLIYKPDLSDLGAKLTEAFHQAVPPQYRLNLHERERKKFPVRLSGRDRCLYELELEGHYLGVDGVKFTLRIIRFVAAQQPEEVYEEPLYLGQEQNVMDLPKLDWKLRYGGVGVDRGEGIFFLQPKDP